MTHPLLSFASASLLLLAFAAPSPQGKGDDGKNLAGSYQVQASADYTTAIQLMRPLVEAQPKNYFLRLRLAYLQLLKGDYGAAAETYRAAAGLEPASLEALLGAQQSLIAAERWDDAEKAGREVLAKDNKNYLGLSRQAWTLFQKKSYAASCEMYRQVLVLYPGDIDMQLGLGYAQLWLGKKGDAEATFKKVLAEVPGHASATQGLGYCK